MWVTIRGKKSTEIEDGVVKRVLDLYPEEKLLERRLVFSEGLKTGSIEFNVLKEESEKILIPWQMFFLSQTNLNIQLTHIEKQRQYKVSSKLFAKRKGSGNTTSKRIVDRLIRQQNFLTSFVIFRSNPFCGSLRGLQVARAANQILSYFDIRRSAVWDSRTKKMALEYLIEQVENRNINVSRGVLTNKLLPTWQVVDGDVYKGSSGFVIRDERVPFVFLPSEINPDEVDGRQIYTLIFLLAIIGLEQYDYFLSSDFKETTLTTNGVQSILHLITTELLIPTAEVEYLRKEKVTSTTIDTFSNKFKVTPSALVTTLRKREIISKQEYEDLKPLPFVSGGTKKKMRHPRVSTSVRKFCGHITYEALKRGIQSGTLASVQAQYLIWGGTNKKGFRKYRDELGI